MYTITNRTGFFTNCAVPLFSLMFSIIIIYIYFLKRDKNIKLTIANKEFFVLLFISLITSVIELILPPLYYEYDGSTTFAIICRIYMIITCGYNGLFILYTLMILKKEQKFFSGFLDISVFSFVVSVILLTQIFATYKITGGFNNTPVAFNGIYIYIFYVYSTIGCVSMPLYLAMNRQYIKNFNIYPLYFGLSLITIYYIISICFNYFINLQGFCQVLLNIVLFFTIESQDSKSLEEYKLSTQTAEINNQKAMDFLVNMSHEIRSPMSSILGFSDLISREKQLDFNSVKNDVKSISKTSEELLELLGNISDISKLESKIETVNNEDYKIENVLFELSSIIQSKMNGEKLNFTLNVDEEMPKEFNGDAYKIYKILSDIIVTSIIGQEEGNIVLNVTGSLTENNFYNFEFTITNSNSNFSSSAFKHNIESYKDGTYKLIDIKLGYIIANDLINILYGTLDYSNENNESKFIIRLPQKVVNKEKVGNIFNDPEVVENRHRILNCSGLKVLIVDDTEVNIKFAKKYLSRYNFDIYTATSGNECIELVKQNRYNLIFLDYMMPDMNGGETIKALEATGIQLPPIVALTANNFNGFKEECIEKGYSDYLQKPIDARELNKLLNRLFKPIE